MRLKTLRVRFALWTAGLFLVVLAVFGIYVYGSMARGLTRAVDDSLSLNASQVAAGLNIDGNRLILADTFLEEPENAELRGRGFTLRIFSPEGRLLQEFGRDREIPLFESQSFHSVAGAAESPTLRVYTTTVDEGGGPVAIVQVAQSLAGVEDTLGRLQLTLWVSVPLLVLLAAASGYLLAARALARIDHITQAARRISAEDLSARLGLPATDDEVGRLAATFDAMLGRLEDSFRRERQFSIDASHELRTPLASMQAVLGVIQARRRTPEEYEQALADLSEETDRLRTLTENLLQLARAEVRVRTPGENVDLSTLLQDVTASLTPLAESKGLALSCDVPPGLTLTGDSDDLVRLFVNFLDNAIKFTDHGQVTAAAGPVEGDGLWVSVADTGVGVPPEDLPHIFDRFYRVDRSRSTPGAGLGLAIAKDIVLAHGGTVEARSEVGKGTTLMVHLPRGGEENPSG